jgi:mRNA interferase MazF
LSSQDRTFSETGLKTTSVIKAERIAVIEKSVIVRKLGSLSISQMEKVKAAVKLALRLD